MTINHVNFSFDFSVPERITWAWRGNTKQLEIPDERVTFSLNDDSIARAFMAAVDPTLADLVNVAISVHLADRLALRERWINGHQVQCCRNLELTIPVANVGLWSDENTVARLTQVLGFLSHDNWAFKFVARKHQRSSETQQFLFPHNGPEQPIVSLFSGGLDSFAGSAIQMSQNPKRPFIAVSASPTHIHLGRQRAQFQALLGAFGTGGTHVVYEYCMRGAAKTLQEPTRRTRAFAFLVLGSVTALAAGSNQLYVHENGFGAINLPYDSSLLGVDMTRAMHPTNLANVGDLISAITMSPFSIVNDCVFLTKGQMCSHSSIRAVAHGLAHTFSCDGMTHAGFHCGYCTSCLLRRMSIESAGLTAHDHKYYLHDLATTPPAAKSRYARGIVAMTWQATRLRKCLSSQDPWQSLTSEFPEIHLAVADLCRSDVHATELLCALYKQHVAEWSAFSAVTQLVSRSAA